MGSNTFGYNIQSEAQKNFNVATDIDLLRNRYLDKDFDKNIVVRLPSFDIPTYDRNYFILLSNCRTVKFIPRWEQRPDYTSYDYFNTTIYWTLILWLNNIPCIEDFTDLEFINIPPFTSIMELTKYKDVNKKPMNLKENKIIYNPYSVYYKKFPLDTTELERRKNLNLSSEESSDLSVEILQFTDEIILDIEDINNKYIDLIHIPQNSNSVSLFIDDYPIAQRYNWDYTLIYDDNEKRKRISWNLEDIISSSNNVNNNGIITQTRSFMSDILQIGTKLIINYTYERIYDTRTGETISS